MGNFFSKTSGSEDKIDVKEKQPTTPILGPKLRTLNELDPRSPSTNVIRTPIQVVLSSIENNTKEIGYETKIPEKLHNKNLDNVRKTLITTPKNDNTFPKLLKSSPITVKPENKRQSFIGLLETNLDCPETDLDMVMENKLCNLKNIDPRSPSTDFIRTPIRLNCLNGEIDEMAEKSDDGLIQKVEPLLDTNIKEEEKVIEVDVYNPTIETGKVDSVENEIEKTPQPVKLIEENNLSNLTPRLDKNIVISEDNVTPISTPKNRKVKSEAKINSAKKINEFNKKLNNLIKEGENENAIIQPKGSNNRTPLGECNGQKKSIPKLKVSDKPRRQDYTISKIPLFKHKKNSENIPPDMKKNEKVMVKWDNENTLII